MKTCWLRLRNFWTECSEARSIFISRLSWLGRLLRDLLQPAEIHHNRVKPLAVSLIISLQTINLTKRQQKILLFQIRIFLRNIVVLISQLKYGCLYERSSGIILQPPWRIGCSDQICCICWCCVGTGCITSWSRFGDKISWLRQWPGHPPLARVIFMYQHCGVAIYWTDNGPAGTFTNTPPHSAFSWSGRRGLEVNAVWHK